MMHTVIGNQSVIITLDLDKFLFDKINNIAEAGFSVIEINCCDQKTLVKALHDFPNLRFGVGNVLSLQQLEESHKAGAHFATSPGFLPSMVQTANLYNIHYLPGVATLSEAMQAMNLGCTNARPFPATLSFCTLLNKYLPLLRLYPAEIEWEEAEHFLNLPAVAAVSLINPEKQCLGTLVG